MHLYAVTQYIGLYRRVQVINIDPLYVAMPLCEVYICPVVHANSKYGEIIKLLARIVLGTLNPFTYKIMYYYRQ